MKLITFITTETNGLHLDNAYDFILKKNLYKYAHLCKLVYHQGYYKDGKIELVNKKSFLVKPEHYIFPESLTKINGLTHSKLEKKGWELEDVMTEFVSAMKTSQVIVGHNLPFHMKTIIASLFRAGVPYEFKDKLMVDIIDYNHKVEKPKLLTLAKEILGKDYSDKPRSYQINIIKKVFCKLYSNMEKEVKGF